MPRYDICIIISENCKNDEEALQLALNKARNERKLNDNNCHVKSITERIGVAKTREIEIK